MAYAILDLVEIILARRRNPAMNGRAKHLD